MSYENGDKRNMTDSALIHTQHMDIEMDQSVESAFMLDYQRYNAFPFRICAVILFRAIYRYAFMLVNMCVCFILSLLLWLAIHECAFMWKWQLTEVYSYGFSICQRQPEPIFKSTRLDMGEISYMKEKISFIKEEILFIEEKSHS